MPSSPTSEPVSWPRVTDARSRFIDDLVTRGLERREATWLVDEFAPGGDAEAEQAVHSAGLRRLAGEPLQYIIGHWPFRELDLDVDPRVLIPRPETEELVGYALEVLAHHGAASPLILDLGCGSGAIGLALLQELATLGIAASLIAVDASADALAVAKRNALKHGLLRVTFIESNWFSAIDESFLNTFDLIVTNPPYIAEAEMVELDDVLNYEPRTALVAGDVGGPGLSDLHAILNEAPRWLSPSGALVAEHGFTQGDAVLAMARHAGFGAVRDLADMAGHPRILVAEDMK